MFSKLKLISCILCIITIFIDAQVDIVVRSGDIMINRYNQLLGEVWESADDEARKTLPIAYQAYACGMTNAEFEYMARVIQAESNGSTDWSDFEDKVLIACVIFNRVESSSFRNTITGVLDEPGQFSTTSNGYCSSSYTTSSRWAIVEAQRRLVNDEVPHNLLYFNCISYNYGTPYGCYGGNYFMTA